VEFEILLSFGLFLEGFFGHIFILLREHFHILHTALRITAGPKKALITLIKEGN
jgi:hypothetical protein